MLGISDLLLVAITGAFVFGGRKLPELGRALRNTLREFKKGLEGKENERPVKEVKELPKKLSPSPPELPN